MSTKARKEMYRVNLVFPMGLVRSVFIRARSRAEAEKTARRRHPKAIGTQRSPYPENTDGEFWRL